MPRNIKTKITMNDGKTYYTTLAVFDLSANIISSDERILKKVKNEIKSKEKLVVEGGLKINTEDISELEIDKRGEIGF